MKTYYKITFKLNGNFSCSVFHYSSVRELKDKLKAWKLEHVTPYNRVEVLTHGDDIEKPKSRRDIYFKLDDGN